MNNRKIIFLIIIIIVITFPSLVIAHPGKTDSEDGHYDYSTGEYHYHHGYPAHQHINGVCPYDYNDKENKSSNTITDSNNTSMTWDEFKTSKENQNISSYSMGPIKSSVISKSNFLEEKNINDFQKNKKENSFHHKPILIICLVILFLLDPIISLFKKLKQK